MQVSDYTSKQAQKLGQHNCFIRITNLVIHLYCVPFAIAHFFMNRRCTVILYPTLPGALKARKKHFRWWERQLCWHEGTKENPRLAQLVSALCVCYQPASAVVVAQQLQRGFSFPPAAVQLGRHPYKPTQYSKS